MAPGCDRMEDILPCGNTMSIIDNKKAFHDYFIEERHEAGLVLEGW